MFSNRLFGPSGIPGAAGQLAQNVQGSVAPAPLPAKQTVTVNTETVINNPALSAQPLLVSIPASALLEQNIFEIHASGYIKCNASSTLTLKLYSGSSATVGSDTLLKSSGAVSAFQATVPFYIIAQLVYDSVSGKLGGTVKFMVNNTLVAEAALANVPTGITSSPTLGAAVISFLLSVTFGTADAGNLINIQEFAIFG
jgi:hypothetical protein